MRDYCCITRGQSVKIYLDIYQHTYKKGIFLKLNVYTCMLSWLESLDVFTFDAFIKLIYIRNYNIATFAEKIYCVKCEVQSKINQTKLT